MSSSTEKLTPQNIEAEQSLLGALLLDKDAIIKVGDRITLEDFYLDKHKAVYEAMSELYRRHEPIDILSLSNRLQEQNQLERIGGRAYLIQLSNAVPTASHVVHYAEIVQKKATLRRLISAASDITALGYDQSEDIESMLDSAEQKLFNVSRRFLKAGFTHIHDVLDTAFERIDEIHRNKGKLRGVATGYTDLDQLLGGMQKSDLIILAARPSCGKTALALDIARNAAVKHKVPVGIFSLEMSKDQLVDRLLCSEANVDLWKMRTGRLSDDGASDDFSRIGHALGVLSESPVYIDDSANANIMEIRTKARRLQMEYGLGMVIVDYLQLMESRMGASSDNRVQEVAEITRGLKSIARELNIPVIALSQLSRQVEMQKPAIPRLAHLRESGCLTGETLIVRADTGERIRLKDIVDGKVPTPLPIFTLDENWKIVKSHMTCAFSSGKKMVYELRTRSGRCIRASANHPFRTLDGWHALEELTPGTTIASKALAASDVYWDEITSIVQQGVEDVYDATVPGLHNFVANDIVVHNSIEQDADIVLFIYRKAADRNYRLEDLAPEEKNLAEIHIAKHRNGPTGVVKLFFDANRASFRNLAKNEMMSGRALPSSHAAPALAPGPSNNPPPFNPNAPISSSNPI